MYIIDQQDKVTTIKSAPQPSAGAPLPFVMSDEHNLLLVYIHEQLPGELDSSYEKVVDSNSSKDPVALIQFHHYYAYFFGPPNDEAFEGHPLADRGLEPYGVFQVLQSSWVRQLERMNSVHPCHDPKRFEKLNHYIFTFHDSTFECVAEDFQMLRLLG
jgi:hypothetical protein